MNRSTYIVFLRIELGSFTAKVTARRAACRKGVELKWLHECGCPIRRTAFCPNCGDVSPGTIRLGYEYNEAQTVILSHQELIDSRPESSKVLNIIGFVSLAKIDPMRVSDSYHLEPVSD